MAHPFVFWVYRKFNRYFANDNCCRRTSFPLQWNSCLTTEFSGGVYAVRWNELLGGIMMLCILAATHVKSVPVFRPDVADVVQYCYEVFDPRSEHEFTGRSIKMLSAKHRRQRKTRRKIDVFTEYPLDLKEPPV